MTFEKATPAAGSLLAEIEADPVLRTRRARLKQLSDEYKGPSALAKALGYNAAAFIVQMIGPNPTRKCSEKSARAFEKTLGLPPGWLDEREAPAASRKNAPAASTDQVNPDLLVETAAAVHKVCCDLNTPLTPAKFGNVVKLAYRDAASHGAVREDVIGQLVQLAG